MRSLIAKEWQENRALIIGLLLLAPLASLAFKALAPAWAWRGLESTGVLLPGLLGLCTLAIAADLVGGDAGSRRIRFLAALPVRPATIWAAKVAFLVLSATLYLGWCFAVEVAIFHLAGRSPAVLFAPGAAANDWLLLVIAAGGAATLFWSTLLDRGLAAAVAGAGTVAAVGFGLRMASKAGFDFSPGSVNLAPVALVTVAALLAGSFLAFTRGRIHLGSRLRRAILATGAFLLVAAPPVAFAGHAVLRYRSIGPSDPDVSLQIFEASPHDPWLVVCAQRREKGPFGVSGPPAFFAVRTTDGLVREIPPTCRAPEFPGPGMVVLHRPESVPGEGREMLLRVVYDLDRGAIESTRPVARPEVPPVRYGPHLVRFGRRIAVESPDGTVRATLDVNQVPMIITAPWGLLTHRGTRGRAHYEVVALDGGETITLPALPFLLPDRRDGFAWRIEHEEETATVLRFRLDGSPGESVLSGHIDGLRTSPDGRFSIVVVDGRAHLLRADADEPEEIAGADLPGGAAGVHWAEHRSCALLVSRNRSFRVTVGPEACSVESVSIPAATEICRRGFFDGERFVVCDEARGTLDCHDLDGRVRRLLPAR
jgi:hypothetical protein